MKKVLYVILGIIALYIILAFIGPAHVKIEKKTSINKPAELVKQYTTDYKFFHDVWSPWTELDPAMKNNYIGSPGQVGHKYEWSGNDKVGTGSMEIMAMNGDSINQKLSFDKRGDSKTYYIVSNNNGATDFTWGVEMDLPFMFRPVMLFTDMGMNERFEKGVTSLKKAMEEMKDAPVASRYTIQEKNWDEVTYIGKKKTVAFDSIAGFFGKHYKNLYSDIEKNKAGAQSKPSAIFSEYDEANHRTDVAAVARVPKGTKIKGWETFTYPASRVLHVQYFGDYAKTTEAHDAINAYMKERGLKEVAIIEEYDTDPEMEKDTTKWVTNIYYMVK